MSIVHLRKARAGSDSWGHSWPKDGAVVEVDYDQAMILLGIPDGGFSVVDNPEPEPEDDSEPGTDGDASEEPEFPEVTPEPEPDASPDAKPAPRRGGRPRKNTETIEEG